MYIISVDWGLIFVLFQEDASICIEAILDSCYYLLIMECFLFFPTKRVNPSVTDFPTCATKCNLQNKKNAIDEHSPVF
mgnify:CR=1 FL=1